MVLNTVIFRSRTTAHTCTFQSPPYSTHLLTLSSRLKPQCPTLPPPCHVVTLSSLNYCGGYRPGCCQFTLTEAPQWTIIVQFTYSACLSIKCVLCPTPEVVVLASEEKETCFGSGLKRSTSL